MFSFFIHPVYFQQEKGKRTPWTHEMHTVLLPFLLFMQPDQQLCSIIQLLSYCLTQVSYYRSILMFKVIDPSQDDDTMIPPLLAYAKQGSATGKLLYANYGRREDFDVLKKNFSISNCEGYIVIIRYGRISRGDKVMCFIWVEGIAIYIRVCIQV